jgi:hypothetical protein
VAAADNHCGMTEELPKSSAKLDDQECEGMSWAAEQELEDGTDY